MSGSIGTFVVVETGRVADMSGRRRRPSEGWVEENVNQQRWALTMLCSTASAVRRSAWKQNKRGDAVWCCSGETTGESGRRRMAMGNEAQVFVPSQ